ASSVGPVEAYPRDLLADALRARERWKVPRHAAEDTPILLAGALRRLDTLPVLEHLFGPVDGRPREHMRVTPDELVADRGDHVVRTKGALGPAELGLKDDLQEEIAELGGKLAAVSAVDGVDHLAGLLEHVTAEGAEVLLPVPGAAVGGEQALHELD